MAKIIGPKKYLRQDELLQISPFAFDLLNTVITLHPSLSSRFNVIKIDDSETSISLLHYPELEGAAFPELAESWRVMADCKVSYRDYRASRNPPILHRRELLMPPNCKELVASQRLTAALEAVGAFDDANRIGFRVQWNALLRHLGFEVRGLELVPIANNEGDGSELREEYDIEVMRHRTALIRSSFSAPLQMLLRYRLLEKGQTFFDYGCGRGDDLRAVKELGIEAAGWDPYFAPEGLKIEADVVNLGFVANVIENPVERREAVLGAYSLAKRVLAVGVMPVNNRSENGVPHGDGVLTSRQTFQRYFTQRELADYLSMVTGREPILITTGIAFVFKTDEEEEGFEMRRMAIRRNGLNATFPRPACAPRPVRKLAARRTSQVQRRNEAINSKVAETRERLKHVWDQALELGRYPSAAEVSQFGPKNYRTTLKELAKYFPMEELERAADERRRDLQLLLATKRLDGPLRRATLGASLRAEIHHFFSSFDAAVEEADLLLKSISSSLDLDRSAREAAEQGFGHYVDSDYLQFHVGFLHRLPPLLRLIVAAATSLHGDLETYDLIKIHLRSHKVSLTRFDDFGSVPLPKMMERVKINLRTQSVDQFLYGDNFAPPYLYFKARYMNEESPHYTEQLAFDEQLSKMVSLEDNDHGPSATWFDSFLRDERLEIEDFTIRSATTIPPLDSLCGRYFTYRQLIECGETQNQLHIDNVPIQIDTYNALYRLTKDVLDPLVDEYGMTEVTFGYCSKNLAKRIKRRIDPSLDQHACCELNRLGELICSRRGAAVDVLLRDIDMREVADWIIATLPFDRLYFYGADRPLHVSVGPEESRSSWAMLPTKTGSLRPTPYALTTAVPAQARNKA